MMVVVEEGGSRLGDSRFQISLPDTLAPRPWIDIYQMSYAHLLKAIIDTSTIGM